MKLCKCYVSKFKNDYLRKWNLEDANYDHETLEKFSLITNNINSRYMFFKKYYK